SEIGTPAGPPVEARARSASADVAGGNRLVRGRDARANLANDRAARARGWGASGGAPAACRCPRPTGRQCAARASPRSCGASSPPPRPSLARLPALAPMTSLVEKVTALNAHLDAAGIAHAFGGALALAYHVQEPRATRDIDLNCFAAIDHAREVFAALPSEITWGEGDVEEVQRVGQVRVFWDDTPVDLFFATHPFH